MSVQHLSDMGYIEFLRFENKPISFYIREGKAFFYCGADKVELSNELCAYKGNGEKIFGDNVEKIEIGKEDFTEKGKITILVEETYYLVAFATDKFFGKKKKVFVLKAGNFEEE